MTELSNQGDFLAFATRLTRQGQFESSAELNNDSHEDSLSSISSKIKNKYRVPWGFFQCRFKLFLVKILHFAILLLMITFVITLKSLTAKTGRWSERPMLGQTVFWMRWGLLVWMWSKQVLLTGRVVLETSCLKFILFKLSLRRYLLYV